MILSQKMKEPRSLTVFAFFMGLLIVGYWLRADYGVSADEPTMVGYGIDSYAYLFQGGPTPTIQDWKFYSPLAQVLMTAVQNMYGELYADEVFALRHFLNFLFFFGAVAFFYRIALKLVDDWRLALLGCVFFVLSPRVFAHGFYNPKDIPTLFFFTFSMWALLRLREKQDWVHIVVCALSCALLLSLRTVGLLVAAFTMWSLVSPGMEHGYRKAAAYAFLLAGFTIAVWPLLWSNPLENFLFAISNNVSRSGGTLYMGETSSENPWHYVLGWMSVTTPFLYSFLFIAGSGFVGWKIVRTPLRSLRSPTDESLVFLWIWIPILFSIYPGIQIFNEWRHLLFIYPAFLLLGLVACAYILRFVAAQQGRTRDVLQAMVFILVAASVLRTSWWMIRNHPLEFGYFSIPSSWVQGNFELDYWGLSYRKGLEKVAALQGGHINIHPAERIAFGSALTIRPEDFNRMSFVEPASADYILDAFITNQFQPRHSFRGEMIDSVEVDGLTLLNIYKGPDTQGVYEAHQYE